MPMTRVEIEEIGPGRWVAEVEGGGTAAVRRAVRAASFDEIILAVVEAHTELTAPPAAKPQGSPLASKTAEPAERPATAEYRAGASATRPQTASERRRAESDALAAEVAALPALNELREQAEALGVDVDGRWGAARLREEIEKVAQARGGGEHSV